MPRKSAPITGEFMNAISGEKVWDALITAWAHQHGYEVVRKESAEDEPLSGDLIFEVGPARPERENAG